MIDTIVLSIPRNKVVITKQEGVSGWDLNERTRAFEKYVKNPSARDVEMGLQFPRLTGWRRSGEDAVINIEFSAPKLLYQNNLDELADRQFGEVVETLRERLNRMGVMITRQVLESAAVSGVNYSKNLELKDYTAQYVIGELGKINLNKKFDLAKTRFLNDGQSMLAHATAHEFVVYDKVADLNKGKKRSIDRNQPPYQRSLFEELNKAKEILRIEVRMKKRKLNALFKELGFKENPTFKEVFSEAKSKAVVLNYWNTMIAGDSLLLFAHTLAPRDLLNQLVLIKKDSPPRKIIYHAGLLWMLREAGGMRSVRAILSKQAGDRTWYKMVAEARETAAALENLKPRDWYDQVMQALQRYEPFRLKGEKLST